MIIRVYRCVVRAGQEEAFCHYAFSASHPKVRAREGIRAFFAGRSLPGPEERGRCMVQLWESEAVLEAALGLSWRESPALAPGALALIETQSVEHYELRDAYLADAGQGEFGGQAWT